MEPRFSFMLVASIFILAVTVASGVPASAFDQREAGMSSPEAVQEQAPQKLNIAGKIESVDAEKGMVRVEGTAEPIMVTPSTRYASGLSFSSLKAGLEVKIVAVARKDGKIEAVEVGANS